MDLDMNQELLFGSSESENSLSNDDDNDYNDYDDDYDYDDDESGFKIPATSLAWEDDTDSESDDISNPINPNDYNAHGVIHVRLLRARNLPCPVGSSVGATVSLQPYKGKIKSARVTAFSSEFAGYGVCVRWESERRKVFEDDDDEYMDEYSDENHSQSNDENLLSMVNGWSGPKSPIPSIRIDLTFSPLGVGILDFIMASLELSTTVLLQNAGVWRKRWCTMDFENSSTSNENYCGNYDEHPSIRIQALFVPTISQKVESFPPKQFITLPPLATRSERTSHAASPYNCNSSEENDNSWASIITSRQQNEFRNPHRKESSTKKKEEDSLILDQKEKLSLPVDAASFSGDASTIVSRKTTNSQMTARDVASLRHPHLLRTQTYWMPSQCAVCKKILVGISNGKGFRCEVCRIDCCSDCRLHVDLRVPCGSERAQEIVETSFRNKISASGLLSYVAPDDVYKKLSLFEEESSSRSSGVVESIETEGIGCCRFEIVTACLFSQNISSLDHTDHTADDNFIPPSLRKGDYYVRISMSDSIKTSRTPTLQKTGGMPNFQSAEMRFYISNYGVIFRLDVVDSDTDMIVGSAVLSTQGILQAQRDTYISEHGVSLIQFLKGPIPWMGKRKMRLSLRSGMKGDASNDDFFPLATPKDNAMSDHIGEVSGWIDIFVGVEEFYSRLYGSNAMICPNRPAESLNMARFSSYIGRITAIIEDLSQGFILLQYIVSWEDPLLTAGSLCLFIVFCVRFNAEYSGSLPILFFIVTLIYFAVRRMQGKIKSSYIRKEVEMMQKVIEVNAVGYNIHRPRGTIRIKVTKGRNLISKELGITRNTSCKVIWDPIRLAVDDPMKKRIVRSDKSAGTPFEIGNTSSLYTADPDWIGIEETGITKRVNQLLPSAENDFFEPNNNRNIKELVFPVLQPFELPSSSSNDGGKLKAWESSKGAIVFQINSYTNIPGFDQVLGEVIFPFGKLVKEKEVKGWFQILDVGTESASPLEDHEVDGEDLFCGLSLNPPRIYIHLKWNPPSILAPVDTSDGEREMSNAIQEEMVRYSILSNKNKFNLVDSSIGAVNRAIGIGGTIQVVQNTLGSILDLVEGIINIINFTDPFKSSTIFVALLLIWLVFIIVPTRHIVLLSGLAQFGVNFFSKYGEVLTMRSKKKSHGSLKLNRASSLSHLNSVERDQNTIQPSPFSVWITNAIRSIPTNEDLRKAYFWESCQLGKEKAKLYAMEKRESRLKKLWKAKWHSSMSVKDDEADQRRQDASNFKPGYFAVVQGHRFIWWKCVDDFDDGEIPSGKVILSGHFGLTGPSPLERKSIPEKDLPLCLTIFGRGTSGQERVTMLLPNKRVKEDLENAVIDSATFKTD